VNVITGLEDESSIMFPAMMNCPINFALQVSALFCGDASALKIINAFPAFFSLFFFNDDDDLIVTKGGECIPMFSCLYYMHTLHCPTHFIC
jgi:hypothetical protein